MATSKLGEMPLHFPEVEQYFKRLRFSLIATGKEEVAKAVLLSTCGQTAFALIETLIAPLDVTAEATTFDAIQTAVLNHLRPKRILHYERHCLHTMVQASDSVTTFLQRLKDQANKCNFGELRDELILCQFIFGLSVQEVKTKLLSSPDLTLDGAVQHALLSESVTAAAAPRETAVATIVSGPRNFDRSANPSNSSTTTVHNRYAVQKKYNSSSASRCFSCGSKAHMRSDCKFRQAFCRKCGRQGHISTACQSAATSALVTTSSIGSERNDDAREPRSPDEIDAVCLAISNQNDNLWHESCKVGKTTVDFLIDTGSQATILPYSLAQKTGLHITSSTQALRAYGGGRVNILGKIHSATITLHSCSHCGDLLVTTDGSKPILGMDFLPNLQLVKECAPLSHDETGFTASFRLRRDVTTDGMRYPARSLPFSMKALVEQEIKRLLAAGIIYPVSQPTVSAPIVPVVKQVGATRPIRICGDYSLTLNRVIDRDSYTLPRLEEILNKIKGAIVYSVLDLEDAYLQVALDPESQLLTCISTHLGHYAYSKMQFGISAAPLIFQEAIDTVLRDIPHVAAYQDDIIIGAPSRDIHDVTLRKVRERLVAHHFKINDRKCQIGCDKVKFLGFILSNGKLLPDPVRIDAFKRLPLPSNKDQLRSLLGSFRHYGQFCPNFSQIARPLYYLLKRDVRWNWTVIHTTAVSTLLKIISTGSITCYDPQKPLFVTSDASKDGLGFILSHDSDQAEIVWTGSRVLTPAESNYSNIEREALAVVEAVKYFHRFLAGRRFTIQSDHAPLRYIFSSTNSLDRVSARLQRWAITLKAYDYSIEYLKADRMHMADTLSRLPLQSPSKVPVVNLLHLNSLQEFSERESLLRAVSTCSDHEITVLKDYISRGWPRYPRRELLPYSKSSQEYSIQDGIVYRGLRVVPPKVLRPRILHVLHREHTGIVRMIRLARQYFWWPGMDQDVNAYIQRCVTCQVNARKRTNANLRSWEDATSFLERVHIDVAHFAEKRYLVFVDAYSKWVDIQPLSSLSSQSAIHALRQTFKYVGLPRCIVSDNGTNFSSIEFDKFLEDNYIRHIRTPPGHHQSNGQAEVVIQNFKFALQKSTDKERTVIAFCLHHNTTPNSRGSVPNSFIFQQHLRTRISALCTEKTLTGEPTVYV